MNNLDENYLIEYAFTQRGIIEILENIHAYNYVAGLLIEDKTINVFYFCDSERNYVYDTIPVNQIMGDTETIKNNIKKAELLKDPEYQQYLKLK